MELLGIVINFTDKHVVLHTEEFEECVTLADMPDHDTIACITWHKVRPAYRRTRPHQYVEYQDLSIGDLDPTHMQLLDHYADLALEKFYLNQESEEEVNTQELETQAQTLDEVSDVKNALLQECDWTQLGDVDLTEDEKKAWREYRRLLRKITQGLTVTKIKYLKWPVRPDSAKRKKKRRKAKRKVVRKVIKKTFASSSSDESKSSKNSSSSSSSSSSKTVKTTPKKKVVIKETNQQSSQSENASSYDRETAAESSSEQSTVVKKGKDGSTVKKTSSSSSSSSSSSESSSSSSSDSFSSKSTKTTVKKVEG